MSLKTQRKSSGMKEDLKEGCEEANDHHLRRAPAQLPSASSLAGRLLLLFAIKFPGVLVLETESLGWQRLGGRGFGESLGAPRFLLMGLVKRSWRISQEIWEVQKLSRPNRRRVVWDSC
jgi:hypothetical protein